MKFLLAASTLVSLIPAALGLTISTPTNAVQCQPLLLSWADGTAPFFLSVIPPGQVSAPALKTFPTQEGNQLTWIVDLGAGTSFNIAIRDNTGATAYSDIVTVQASPNSTCANTSSPPSTATGGSSSPSGGSSTGTSDTSTPSDSNTSSGLPTATRSTPIGAIVGGVVGGIAGVVILTLALLWCFLRKRSRGGRAYYFEKPTPVDILAGEAFSDRVEPFNATIATTTTAPSSPRSSGLGPQPAHYDGSSQPLDLPYGQTIDNPNPSQHHQSGPRETVPAYISGSSERPGVGVAVLSAPQSQDGQQPSQSKDSGIRFNENGEQEAGLSRTPGEVPPAYTPD